ncbi:hypothetical protein [Marinobacter sp. R17]|uniref:hypothetical protein n=1 Tax=Marinobacter sp. R17 TaxID=2484250 RepID=UPI001CC1E7F5|nr:hypothetical protein [Marinobacter sp. R17]
MSDQDYVNFSQDHELNYRLRRLGKRQTEDNREMLRRMGEELKTQAGKPRLQHGDFHTYASKEKRRLD